ncbi:GNAT family N-acetyltransferase [Ruegeria marina]|uniref:Acetyltransferase (GNAT) family protein n=1 Tax=Ruegeria marina TaxID=639004 RepID=A0A1G6WVJ4_9RHOB|nr:GNAT family N-acetyltransferase [Ruegeria marina]SDD69809.1 Acetyltransferase (GNAT) family protein [Ruegeria marina]
MTPDWFAVVDATWPAARIETRGNLVLREGRGGGKRVSAASAMGPLSGAEIGAAEDAMRAMGQQPLFQLRPGNEDLDAELAERGYDIVDPVNIYAIAAERLTDIPIPRVTVFTLWEPLAIMRELWAQGGIGPGRLAVMDRTKGPKTGLLMRHRDKPGGVAFVAIHDSVAMLHALEIPPHQRRQGLGKWAMRGAAFWALDNGAQTLSVVCTKANEGANALYRSLGMEIVGEYHYRLLDEGRETT